MLMKVRTMQTNIPVCVRYQQEVAMKHQVFISPWQQFNTYKPETVTLVVHLTANKIPVFSTLLSHWDGPVSAAISVHTIGTPELKDMLQMAIDWQHRDNIDIHMVPISGVSGMHAIKDFPRSHWKESS